MTMPWKPKPNLFFWPLCLVFFLATIFVEHTQAQVLAIVGKKKITLEEFEKRYQETESAFNQPTPQVFLEDLIRFEMGVQQAEKEGLKNHPLVHRKMRQEMYKLLLERKLSDEISKIKVTEKDLRQEYKKSPELRTSHILVEIPDGATKEQEQAARKRALKILKKVKQSDRPFAQLAKNFSDDSLSKNSGGDLGSQSRASAVPAYYNAALKLDEGAVSDLVRTRYGYHIIKLTGRNTFKQANHRQLRALVFERKRKEIFDKYFEKLKDNYKIRVNKKALRKISQ